MNGEVYQITDLPAVQEARLKARKGEARTLGRGARGGDVAAVLLKLEKPSRITIKAGDFDTLAVDKRYQREEVKDIVAVLINVLKRGGVLPDPITVVKRKFAENGEVSKQYWIVDGQQRMWASLECGTDLLADCYEVDSLDEERALFFVLNNRARVSGNRLMNAHPGPTACLIREINSTESHPLHQRINLLWVGDEIRVNAATIATGLGVLYGSTVRGITRLLTLLDPKMKKEGDEKGRAFLKLLGEVHPTGRIGFDPTLTLAQVAAEKWEKRTTTFPLPDQKGISRLRRIKWTGVVAGSARDRQLLLRNRISAAWDGR